MSQDTRKTLIDSLHELILEGKKISIKSVAEKAGLSHSIIYNRYPELKCIIKEEQQKQADQLQKNKERNEEIGHDKNNGKYSGINQYRKGICGDGGCFHRCGQYHSFLCGTAWG